MKSTGSINSISSRKSKWFKSGLARVCALALVVSFVSVPAANAGWFSSWFNKNYTKTKYPIVLAHGFLGFDSLLGVIDYWPGIVEALEKDGATVFVTQVSTVNSSQVRGEQLLAQVEEILAVTGAEKVNLFGHSQGSLDARYVASVRPDLVASISSVGGPHNADVAEAFNFGETEIVSVLLEGLGNLLGILSGNPIPTDMDAAAAVFTVEGMEAFNSDYPLGLPASHCGEGSEVNFVNGHQVNTYSWGGVSTLTTGIDPTDYIFVVTGSLFSVPNDGLVTRCANHFGKVIRDDFRHNHIDLNNLFLGIVPIFETNPKSVFRTQANRLKKAGL